MNYLSNSDLEHFKTLESQIGAGTDLEAAALNIGDLCKRYHALKGTLQLALKAVEKIPFVGKKIAKAIRFLMSVADLACPTGGVENASAESTDLTAEGEGSFKLTLAQLEAFERLDAALGGSGTTPASFEFASAEAFNKDEICKQYKKVRKFLKPLLPIIALIPTVGPTIVAIIELLMKIGDSICGAN